MALETYRKMRDFAATPEPRGRVERKRGDHFVVQKHDATRLHYDLRLEMGGVLKSWAVTRGPSLVAGEKRLAVHVEDHPLDYGGFEGVIPKGSYGAGTVIVWDAGTWSPIGDPAKGYAKGHLEFELSGQKLSGRWHLVRMQGKPDERRENWLLIKAEDEAARPVSAPDILKESPDSVQSGRSLAEVAASAKTPSSKAAAQGKHAATSVTKAKRQIKPGAAELREASAPRPRKPRQTAAPSEADEVALPDPSRLKSVKKASMPGFVEPMLTALAPAAPTGESWLHEIKFDGYRLQARIEAGRVKLLTRSGLDWTAKFGKAIPAALRNLPFGSAILDGEVVVETGNGASDFSALQAALSEGHETSFLYYAFDLLYLDGYDLTALALSERKSLLENLLTGATGPLRYSAHFTEAGAMVLRHACRLGLEGIISKQAASKYKSGRGRLWIKSKCSARQEFVIGGYLPSTSAKQAIGSLALGVYDGDRLEHVGRVGTGFTAAVARDLYRRFEALRSDRSPFASQLTSEQSRGLRWLRPELVAEVDFRAWTADGNLRHAAFRGLREDKSAREVIREGGQPMKAAKAPKRLVKLTHPDRIFWPETGLTKEGLADYYAEIWPQIGPFVVNRPLALLRCPTGIEGERFFQKHLWKGAPDEITRSADPAAPEERLISITDLSGLMALVQSAALELHPWGATLDDWERPDMLTMDLDPGDGTTWQQVIDAALEIRQRLSDQGLTSFVKTSGGKGLHVVAPLKPHADWTELKAMTKAIAEAMSADSPKLYVATVSKAKRKGKILIDYLRNQRGATAVAAYSTRARPGAAVSTPISWDELGPSIGPDFFTVATLPTRIAALAKDPWDGFWKAAVPLKPAKASKRR